MRENREIRYSVYLCNATLLKLLFLIHPIRNAEEASGLLRNSSNFTTHLGLHSFIFKPSVYTLCSYVCTGEVEEGMIKEMRIPLIILFSYSSSSSFLYHFFFFAHTFDSRLPRD